MKTEPMTMAAKIVMCMAIIGAGSILLGFVGLVIAAAMGV